jgi:hypothetical protein
MFIEKYLTGLERDILEIEETLRQSVPRTVADSLAVELEKLRAAKGALVGNDSKSRVHQLRASLRWARKRSRDAKDPAKRRESEREVKKLLEQIERQVRLDEGAP